MLFVPRSALYVQETQTLFICDESVDCNARTHVDCYMSRETAPLVWIRLPGTVAMLLLFVRDKVALRDVIFALANDAVSFLRSYDNGRSFAAIDEIEYTLVMQLYPTST